MKKGMTGYRPAYSFYNIWKQKMLEEEEESKVE